MSTAPPPSQPLRDLGRAGRQQLLDDKSADEPGATRYENLQASVPRVERI